MASISRSSTSMSPDRSLSTDSGRASSTWRNREQRGMETRARRRVGVEDCFPRVPGEPFFGCGWEPAMPQAWPHRRSNSIPKGRSNALRFWDHRASHRTACPACHFDVSARNFLTTWGTAFAMPLSGRPHATSTAVHRSTNFPIVETGAALPRIPGAAWVRR